MLSEGLIFAVAGGLVTFEYWSKEQEAGAKKVKAAAEKVKNEQAVVRVRRENEENRDNREHRRLGEEGSCRKAHRRVPTHTHTQPVPADALCGCVGVFACVCFVSIHHTCVLMPFHAPSFAFFPPVLPFRLVSSPYLSALPYHLSRCSVSSSWRGKWWR